MLEQTNMSAPPPTASAHLDVSVVVCTFNRPALLRRALQDLGKLTTGGRFRYEVVVIDNGSTDNTAEVIAEAVAGAARRAGDQSQSDRPVEIRTFCESQRGISAARNRGVQEARGEWIAFFDDDEVPNPDWLQRLMAMAQQQGARCVGGRTVLLLPEDTLKGLSDIARNVLGETVAGEVPRRYTRKLMPGAGNLLLHRTVFDQIGTFDGTLREGGEDADLYRRIRAADIDAWYTPDAVVRHEVPAYRLRQEYFRWTCLRQGWHVARRDRREFGAALFPLMFVARIGQAAVSCLPRQIRAWLTRNARDKLDAKCRLWRVEGNLRGSLLLMAPRLLQQTRFASQLDFRDERAVLAPLGVSPALAAETQEERSCHR